MKKALILHGTNGSPQGNWFQWLKQELEKKGWNVWVPDLPHSEKPNIDRYTKFIKKNNPWDFDSNTTIIGHSSGAVAALGVVQNLQNNTKIRACICVAAFKNNLGRDDLKELFEKPLDFEAIKKGSEQFIFVHSDNDPYIPLEQPEYLANHVNGKMIVFKGQGHFNLEQGPKYKKFPELLSIINKS